VSCRPDNSSCIKGKPHSRHPTPFGLTSDELESQKFHRDIFNMAQEWHLIIGGFDYPRKRNGKGQSFCLRMSLPRTESPTLNDIYAVQPRRKTYVDANIRRVFLRNSNEAPPFRYESYFLFLFYSCTSEFPFLSIHHSFEPTTIPSSTFFYDITANYPPGVTHDLLTCLLTRGAGAENCNMGSLRILFPASADAGLF
jgi:hypothetical protein